MNKIIGLLLSLSFSLSVYGQESKSLIDSYEFSMELGLGGALIGAQLKLNHRWIDKNRYNVFSSLGYSSYWGKLNTYTKYNDYLVERSEITGFTSDNHIRIYTGARVFLLKNQRLSISGEGYVGGFNTFQKGRYIHERLSVDQEYSAGQTFFDYGTRIGFGVKIYKSMRISINITNSLRKLGYGYKLIPTLYQYAPDNKQSVGLSVYWNY